MMRVLLATDGSESANNAVETVRNLALPAGSVIHLVAVLPSTPELFGAAWDAYVPGDAESIEQQMIAELGTALDRVKARIERPGVSVEEEVLRGRAATKIVEAANTFGADVVVVGSRGHGVWKRLLLGSVSAEIVDHAKRSVLVARKPSVQSVVLGTDGSEGARFAAQFLARFPALAGERVKLAAVAEILSASALGFSPAVSGAFMTEMIESTAEADERLGEVTEATASILSETGIPTETAVVTGDPATELVRLARSSDADLVVVGTSGLGGIARAVLGSVARNVLINARCSVLVVHQPAERKAS